MVDQVHRFPHLLKVKELAVVCRRASVRVFSVAGLVLALLFSRLHASIRTPIGPKGLKLRAWAFRVHAMTRKQLASRSMQVLVVAMCIFTVELASRLFQQYFSC